MRVVALEDLLEVLENDLPEEGLTRKAISVVVEELAEDARRVFSPEEIADLLARGSPVGSYESELLAIVKEAGYHRR